MKCQSMRKQYHTMHLLPVMGSTDRMTKRDIKKHFRTEQDRRLHDSSRHSIGGIHSDTKQSAE